MFSLCQGMKWAHLPVAGGLYDQDPDLLDKFNVIFDAIARHERAEREREKKEAEKNERKMKSSSRMANGRMRRR